MSEKDLRDLLALASRHSEKMLAKTGEVKPLWHAIKSNGEEFITPHPTYSKDLSAALIRAAFELEDVIRYIYVGEGWTLNRADTNKISVEEFRTIVSIADHPNRIEIVMIQGEDIECGMIMAQRKIIRSGKLVCLGPIEYTIEPGNQGVSEGRMVGMLPQRGTKQ